MIKMLMKLSGLGNGIHLRQQVRRVLLMTTLLVKLDIFEITRTQNVLTYERYLCCLQ